MNSSSPQKERTSAISRNGHNKIVACSETQSPTHVQDQKPYKRLQVRYMECLKNHAAAIGGSATDGCGEFMPSGEEGTIEALQCSACNCHRNFHRKELECECAPSECHHSPAPLLNNGGRALILGHQNHIVASSQGYPSASTFISIGAEPPHHHHQVIMPYKSGSAISESDEKDDGGGGFVARPLAKLRKRFRTKFTQEQKEKMLNFAEKAGWRIQKLEESVVQQFCQEIGIKRRVLKVWMHNNKHSLAKKTPLIVEASNN